MIRKEDFAVIQALHECGVYQKDIAAELNVHPKTVSRALQHQRAPEREWEKGRQQAGWVQRQGGPVVSRGGMERSGHSARDPGRRL